MNDNVYLFTESGYYSKPILQPSNQSNPNVTIFKAILQEAEVPNRNGRIYSKKAIDEALHRNIIQERLLHRTLFGECSHPFEDTVKRQTHLEFERYTHIITKFWWEGNLLWGIIETLDTRLGRDFRGIIRQRIDIAFSMRGVGGKVLKKDGYDYIDSDLYIMTYDHVGFPSHPPAYINEIIKEDYNLYNEDTLLENNKVQISLSDPKIKKLFLENSQEAVYKELVKAKKSVKEDNKKILSENALSVLDRNFF